jgi:hypothetical protein
LGHLILGDRKRVLDRYLVSRLLVGRPLRGAHHEVGRKLAFAGSQRHKLVGEELEDRVFALDGVGGQVFAPKEIGNDKERHGGHEQG